MTALRDFTKRTVSYERTWPAPLDDNLRLLADLAIPGVVFVLAWLLGLGSLHGFATSGSWFSQSLAEAFCAIVNIMLPDRWLILLANLDLLGFLLILRELTEGFQYGSRVLHCLCLAAVVPVILECGIIALAVALIIMDVVLWVVAILLLVALLGGLCVAALLGGSSGSR